jgi:hypothetical protein
MAGMPRVLTGLAAWLGGTAAAVGLAWFGAGLVVRNTTTSPAGPVVPVVSIAPPASTARAASAGPGISGPGSASPGTVPARPRPSASGPSSPGRPAAAPSPAGTPRSYMLAGGQVTLLLTRNSARLVTAVPEAGFAVQTWSGPGWLRVDFSSGAQVSSLIASWNGHPPSVVTTN